MRSVRAWEAAGTTKRAGVFHQPASALVGGAVIHTCEMYLEYACVGIAWKLGYHGTELGL
jgi:hypothetical protein